MAPLEDNLRKRLDDAATLHARTIRAAELGCYLARTGRIDAANKIAAEIRSQVGLSKPDVAIWTLLLEGLIRYFSQGELSPRERIERAVALSLYNGDASLTAKASAWYAHFLFLDGEFERMGEALRRVLDNPESAGADPIARCRLILACSYTLVGDDRRSRELYEKARLAAVDLGDEALIGAIIYNRAIHKISRRRFERRTSLVAACEDAQLELEVYSGKHFDRATANRAMWAHSDVWLARLLLLQGKAESAMKILDGPDLASQVAAPREGVSLATDKAWCRVALGDYAGASDILSMVPHEHSAIMDPDDLAILLSIRIFLVQQGAMVDDIDRLSAELSVAVTLHNSMMASLGQQLALISDPS